MQAADARAELCYMCNNATTQILCRSPAHPAAGCAGLLKIFSSMAPHISAVFLAAGHPTLLVLSCFDLQGRCVTPSHGHKPLFPFYSNTISHGSYAAGNPALHGAGAVQLLSGRRKRPAVCARHRLARPQVSLRLLFARCCLDGLLVSVHAEKMCHSASEWTHPKRLPRRCCWR